MPFDNTHVIHPDWAARHRPVVAGSFTATCEIRRPGGTRGDFDETTGSYPTVPYPPHYTGGCRIQVLAAQDQEALVADQEVTTLGYLIVVDRDTSKQTQVNDVVKVTSVDTNGDPLLAGRELTVQSFTLGSLSWERDLTCIDNLD